MKIVLDEGAFMPEYAHDTDSGMDLRTPIDFVVPALTATLIDNKFEINGGSAIVNTGIHIEIPKGCTGFLKSKSGLNVKDSIVSEGVIDEGYTGSVVVKLYNRGVMDKHFKRGDKITQLVILQTSSDKSTCLVDTLDKTERGENGFGSTGR